MMTGHGRCVQRYVVCVASFAQALPQLRRRRSKSRSRFCRFWRLHGYVFDLFLQRFKYSVQILF